MSSATYEYNGPSGAGAGQVTTPTFPTNLPAGFIDYSQYLNTTPREGGASGSGTGTPVEYKMGEPTSTAIPTSLHGTAPSAGAGAGMEKQKEKGTQKEESDKREKDDESDSEDMDK